MSQTDTTRSRVSTARQILGQPTADNPPVEEGVHYTVLAYTDRGGMMIPTMVRWANGETDSFRDSTKSRGLRAEAKEAVQTEPFLDRARKHEAERRRRARHVRALVSQFKQGDLDDSELCGELGQLADRLDPDATAMGRSANRSD